MKIYEIKHFWSGDEKPTSYIMASLHEPTDEEAVAACDIDFDDSFETLEIEEVKVIGAKLLVEVGGVDWKKLRAQKLLLLKAAEKEQDLHDIVHLLDSVQDQAAENLGAKKVFGSRKG